MARSGFVAWGYADPSGGPPCGGGVATQLLRDVVRREDDNGRFGGDRSGFEIFGHGEWEALEARWMSCEIYRTIVKEFFIARRHAAHLYALNDRRGNEDPLRRGWRAVLVCDASRCGHAGERRDASARLGEIVIRAKVSAGFRAPSLAVRGRVLIMVARTELRIADLVFAFHNFTARSCASTHRL